MNRTRRLVAVLLAGVLGATLTSAPAEAATRGTLVVARAPAERIELFVDKREGDQWRRVDWTGGNEYTVRVLPETVEFDLPPGDYRVSFRRDFSSLFHREQPDLATTYYPDVERAEDAEVVAIHSGRTEDLTSFRPLTGGHVNGVARREDGSTLPEYTRVEALQDLGYGWTLVGYDEIGPDGFYDIAGLGSGATVLKVFGGSISTRSSQQAPDAETFSGGSTSFEDAARIAVASGSTAAADPIAVPSNGTLSGVVRDADGVPLAGVEVDTDMLRRPLTTAADGSWTLGPLRAGTYSLSVSDPAGRVVHERREATVELGRATVEQSRTAHQRPLWSTSPSLDTHPYSTGWDQPITVDPGTLLQEDAVVTGIRWYEGLGPGRVLLASGPTYTPPRSLDGGFVSAEVTARRKGLESSLSSPAVEVRDPEYFVGRPDQSSRAPVAHQVLTARQGTLSPDPTTTTWRWLRDGRTIAGATGQRYRPTPADVGRNVVAEATVTRPGYARAVVRSTSRDVAAARSSVWARVTPKGGGRVAVTASVAVAKVETSLADGSLDLYRSRKGSDRIGTIRVVDGRAATTLTGQPKGTRTYWVRFRPSRDGMLASTGTRARVGVR